MRTSMLPAAVRARVQRLVTAEIAKEARTTSVEAAAAKYGKDVDTVKRWVGGFGYAAYPFCALHAATFGIDAETGKRTKAGAA